MLTIFLTTFVAATPLAERSTDRVKLEAFLARPFMVFKHDRTPASFRVIALSNLAEYCGRRGQTNCLRRTAEIALDPRLSPFGDRDLRTVKLGSHGLYLAHLLVILTEVRARLADKQYDAHLHLVARHLRERSHKSPNHHIASYPRDSARYPADQAVVLFALHRYDKIFGTKASQPLIREWLDFMATQGATRDGLHRSEVAGAAPWGGDARGCAMSWTIRYMAAFAPAAAVGLWQRYVKRYEVDALWFSGFREWPPGVDRPADHDSGPIFRGIGVAATAFALGASRAVGDMPRHRRLVRTMGAVYQATGYKAHHVGNTVLARAIALNSTK